MTNIEEMEYEVFRMNRDWQDRALMNFASLCLNELKDLHEENTKLQSEVAKHSEYIKNLKKEIKELKNENNL